MSDVLYPGCPVQLTGEDGNAFAILARVSQSLRRHLRDAGMDGIEIERKIEEFTREATAGDYDNLLRVCMRWVDVE